MTALVREWLLGVTGAAILAALAEGLMPQGAVKQAGKLICGLVLLLVVLSPLGGGDTLSLNDIIPEERDIQRQAQQLREEADKTMQTVIEEELSAYSMDKAAQMGLACQVRVFCSPAEGGVFLPSAAEVTGALLQEDAHAFAAALSADLGIPADNIRFQEGGDP